MGGTTLWIILGVLVGVVAIFLVVAAIKDRKKVKHIKKLKAEAGKKAAESKGEIAIYINLVSEANEKLLKNFVPSVGKLKMKDIKDKAKNALNKLKHTDEYRYAIESDQKDDIQKHFEELVHTNSNTWSKNCVEALTFFKKLEESLEDKEKYQVYKKTAKESVTGVYK